MTPDPKQPMAQPRELLPCPFCGGSHVETYQVVYGKHIARCEGCGGESPMAHTASAARTRWNRRAESASDARQQVRSGDWDRGYASGYEAGATCSSAADPTAPRATDEAVANDVYGRCPQCGSPGVSRERRPNGNDRCSKGHSYPSRDAIHAAPRTMAAQPAADGNWPEDFSHENGNYQCQCVHCERIFIGHKRRVCCKVCYAASPAAPVAQADALDAMRHIANEWADAATNGLQWLRNVADGISTPADGIAEMTTNIARIRAIAAQANGVNHGI